MENKHLLWKASSSFFFSFLTYRILYRVVVEFFEDWMIEQENFDMDAVELFIGNLDPEMKSEGTILLC